MRESRTFGSVGGEGGNVLAYPAISCRHLGRRTTAEDDPCATPTVQRSSREKQWMLRGQDRSSAPQRRGKARTDVDFPQFAERGVIERRNCAIQHREKHKPAAGCERAALDRQQPGSAAGLS